MFRALFLVLALAPSAAAQQFVPTREPVYQGTRATADLPATQHHQNTGGSDGAGLCVYTSFWHQAIWQSVRDVWGFRDWMTKRPGGSYPDKFDATLAAFCKEKQIPLPRYVQHTGGDAEFLKLALKTGRMLAVTYCGVDDFYGSSVVAHMVNLVHLDSKLACIIDNNRAGWFVWMSADDFLARWRGVQKDGRPYLVRTTLGRWSPIGGGWAIALLDSPPTPYPAKAVTVDHACQCGPDCKCGPECDCGDKIQVGQLFRKQEQCPGGKCPLPSAPSAKPSPVGNPPAPDYDWAYMGPVYGWGWLQRSPWYDFREKADGTWGWVKKPTPVESPKPRLIDEPLVGQDPFPGGVAHDKLFADEGYSISGKKCDKITALAALAAAGGLADDSNKWNLAAVGDAAFTAKVRADVAKLAPELRDKLHVQCYAPEAWEAKQFDLLPGLTLRQPAVGRVAPTAGVVTPTAYTAAKLDELLAPVSGKTPTPQPPPKKPDTPVDPVPPVDPPAPAPTDRLGILALLIAITAVVLTIFRR